MNRKYNAEQMLGVASNASPEEISNAFKAKVSELSQQNISTVEFQQKLNQLYSAHDYLIKYNDDFFDDFSYPFLFRNNLDNYMKQFRQQMKHDFNDFFEQHNRRTLDMNHNFINQTPSNNDNTYSQISNQNFEQPKTYKYARTFSKTIKIDNNGNVVGSSHKTIHNNDKVFKEEKQFDSTSNKMYIKRYKPNGTIEEFEKPFNQKYKMIQ